MMIAAETERLFFEEFSYEITVDKFK